jgi:hypothetical protein
MEIVIVICLLIVIALLLQDKIVIKKRSEQKPTREKSIRTCPILWGSLNRKKPFSAKHCQ